MDCYGLNKPKHDKFTDTQTLITFPADKIKSNSEPPWYF